jgi:glycosyltransferase involved in cell wall biosynthesis
MKILIIHNRYQFWGGEDVVFESELEILRKNGHIIDTLIFDNKNIKTFLDKLIVAVGTVYNIKSKKILKNRINAFKPDVIHVHNFYPIASPSIFFIAKKLKVPIVMTLHNYRLICPSTTLFYNNEIYEKNINHFFPYDAIVNRVYRDSIVETTILALTITVHKLIGTWNSKVTYYIALTEFARNKFLNSSLHVSAEKIVVKPNFVADNGYNIAHRGNYFLFIGRLSTEKGISKIIEVASELPDVEFRIIGDGPLKKDVENASKDCNNISYLGFRDKGFILDQLKSARALIFPSLWYEGFPMTILEALSCGTPILASDLGGPKEILTNGYNGYLFDYQNKQDLIEKIIKISSEDDSQRKMCENARNTYEMLYTPEINYEQLIEIYNVSAL